jgi:long-chain acyl-CoA synthetase
MTPDTVAGQESSIDRPWLKFYDEGVAATLSYPQKPLDQLLAETAAKHPDQQAIVFGGRVGSRILDKGLTYRQLDEAVNRFAAALQELGFKEGDRLGIVLPNCPQFVIAFYGAMRAGGIAAPSNFLYSGPELARTFTDTGIEIAVVLSSYYEKLHGIRGDSPLRHIVVARIKDYFPTVLRFLFTVAKEKKEGHYVNLASGQDRWFGDFLTSAPPRPSPVARGMDDTACLLGTGGTTGIPKSAQLSHGNLVSNANAGLVWSHSREANEITIGALPLFHSYGMTSVMNMCVAGALTMVLIPDPRDILHIMGAITKHGATFYPGVPTMYVGINNHPQVKEFDLSSITVCLSGAAPLPREVQEKFQDLTGAKLVEAYGLTETSPATHVNPVLGQNKIGFIGLPWPDTDARIVDLETGETELPQGEIGELIINGPQVMKGYWQQPTETANTLRSHPDLGPGLWLHTGDIALMDEEGYFQIVDRKKDMIICGGYNVYPRDVEEVLFEHPAVQEAAVTGVPDEYRGETVKAFVVLKEGAQAEEDEIIAFCRERLAGYKVPRNVEFRQSLPKSTVGKVLRRELE